MACPEPTQLVSFALRQLAPETVSAIGDHIDTCPACRAASSALVTVSRSSLIEGESTPWTGPRLAAGDRIDRYVVIHELGEGAASVVYAAHDPELDRKVALKLLRSRGADLDDRLLREGRALAKLSHPNVAKVYEIGNAGGQLYIALELIAGVTARQWLAIAPRSWREIRDVYVAAGRGVAAIHRAGLVHRDIKPDNIVVGADGAVCVVDLGLVGAGAHAGTPAYMAPEVTAGAAGEAACDQYGLCASLCEALGNGRLGPRRLHRAIARGMATDPQRRFASVEALVSALGDRPRRRLAIASGLFAAAGVAAIAISASQREPATSCRDQEFAMYPPAIASAIDRVLATSTRRHAADTRQRVVPALARYANEWRDERVAVCQAYHVRHEIADARFDLQVGCLERQRAAFDSTLAQLQRGGDEAIDRAIELVSGLPPITECRGEVRTEPLPVEPERRQAIARIEAAIAEADVLEAAGDERAAIARARAAVDDARGVGYQPVLARATLLLGNLLRGVDDDVAARPLFDEAIQTAAAARLDGVEAHAWSSKVDVIDHASDAELAIAKRAAEAAVGRAATPLARARLANALGNVARRRGEYTEARDHFQAALANYEADAASPSGVTAALANLAGTLAILGDQSAARAAAANAAARDREQYGPNHPRYAASLVTLATVEADAASEIADLKQALPIVLAAYGEASTKAMIVHLNLAAALEVAGELDEADRHAKDGLAIAQRLRGNEHLDTAKALIVNAKIAAHRADFSRAEELAARAYAIVSSVRGSDHPLAATILADRGEWAFRRGDFRSSERLCRDALAVLMNAAPESRDVAITRSVLGEALLEQRKYEQAIVELDETLAHRVRIADEPIQIAYAQFALARALWSGGQQARARELARAAAAGFTAVGEDAAEYQVELGKWAKRVRVSLTEKS